MASSDTLLGEESYRGPDGKGWICERCGEAIKTAGDGWLQWIEVKTESGDHKMRDLTLVHHVPASPREDAHPHGCQFDGEVEYRNDKGTVADLQLAEFCGADGLMRLLSLIAENESVRADLTEMIKRIQIPGYERARRYMNEAIRRGVIEPNLPSGCLWQSDIQAILRWEEERDH